jgi:hypothetical protein
MPTSGQSGTNFPFEGLPLPALTFVPDKLPPLTKERNKIMAVKSKETKWTPAEIKEQIKYIEKATEKRRKESKGENFTAISRDEIEKKLTATSLPYITNESWTTTTPPGGTCTYTVEIYNPPNTSAASIYLHVFVGSGNIDPTVGTFLLNVDTRFPRLTQPAFPGLTIASGTHAVLIFPIKVPTTVEKTAYLGNCCLMQLSDWMDIGKYLDRAVFPFAVA